MTTDKNENDNLTHVAKRQVILPWYIRYSIFWNSDLCTTNFRFV